MVFLISIILYIPDAVLSNKIIRIRTQNQEKAPTPEDCARSAGTETAAYPVVFAIEEQRPEAYSSAHRGTVGRRRESQEDRTRAPFRLR